jgi:hypothetical protein
MSRRRLVPLALGVTLLLVVVAIAARGRPLGKNSTNGGGLPVTFWDYVFTTLVILEVFLMIGAVVTFFVIRRERTETRRGNQRTFRTLMILVVGGGLLALIAPHIDLSHLHAQNQAKVGGNLISGAGKAGKALHAQHVQFQWKELALIAGILLALVAAAVATRKRLAPATAQRGGAAPEVLAAALDESLDDLRNDPDLRRAIIAAYARMETALAAAGLPRHEAEAPFEYLERALLSLDTSAPAVHRLTDLFEWARFSHHEPEPWMRDEAVEALVAVRDELRASELALA